MFDDIVSWVAVLFLVVFLLVVLSRFRPANTQGITNRLYVAKSGIVNFYALRTDDGIVLFDTGTNPQTARRELRRLGISPDEVTDIFLTHSDYDHAGGLSAFPTAKRYLPGAEEQMINGQTARRWFMRNKYFSVNCMVQDNETVVLGDTTVQALLRPGHTPGSTVYLIDNRFLVCGDLLRISRSGALLPFFWLMNMDHRQDIRSLEATRVLLENAEYILTGHSGFQKVSTHTEQP